ncbi:MAG TPA: hypothetical protein DCQ34_02555 [Chitinophagaceae bacterium]|nr:hypothetical protein [Chitinophagaceae bacterium]
MRRLFVFLLICSAGLQTAMAQRITYSEYNKKDGRDTHFEILGRFDSSYLVYKIINRKHFITGYDQKMRIAQHKQLDFLDEKTFNVDFINYNNFLYLIYQFQRNNVVYCKAVKMNERCELLSEPVVLDTTRVGFFADNKIYSVAYSENKEKILIYKRQVKNDWLTIATRLFDKDMNQLDSTRQLIKYDDRRDFFSELVLDNDGSFLFARGTGKSRRQRNNSIHVSLHKPGMDTFRVYRIDLNDQYVNEVNIKADNLNRYYLVNACYEPKKGDYVEGLFTALIDMNGEKPVRAVFNPFSDSLRLLLNPSDKSRFAFENLNIRYTVLKKKGGFVLAAEEYYTENIYNNIWNRNYRFYNNFYSGTANDFFINNPYYYYGYRPWSLGNRDMNTRYYYNDIIILILDSALRLQWNNVIHKKQYDVDTENFLSFSTFNAGSEIRFLFIDKDNQKQIISNHALQPDGQINRYPTVRSTEMGYGFMPRLAKQVGARQVIIPYVYLGYISFAKIDFPD